MSRGGAKSAQKIGLAERRGQAWELRKQGHDFRAIAAKLGYSKSSAERDIKHVMATLIDRTVESAAEARAIDLARLDDLLVAWFAPAAGMAASDDETAGADDNAADEGGEADPHDEAAGRVRKILEQTIDKDAAAVVLKILEQRAKLLGLYRQEVALTTPTPLRVDAGVDLSGLDEESLNAIIGNLTAALGAGDD